jgi:adenylate cyclase class IV
MCIVIDERETKLYDAVVELVRLGTFNVPDQVVKRVLVLGDICIRNEDDQDVYYRAQVRAGSNSEYQRLEVRGTVAPTYPRKQRQAA